MPTKTDPYTALRYVGKGAFLLGVPARDLSSDEVRELAEQTKKPEAFAADLVAGGLYAFAQPVKEASDGTRT